MNERYLFRGKRKDNGEWAYGYLYITHNGEYEIGKYKEDINIERITYIVIPETVGQYTGLEDKNGKKIFEGDIIKAYFKSNRSKQRFSVVFENGTFLFDNGHVKVPINDIYCLKIIGNIHDNP